MYTESRLTETNHNKKFIFMHTPCASYDRERFQLRIEVFALLSALSNVVIMNARIQLIFLILHFINASVINVE